MKSPGGSKSRKFIVTGHELNVPRLSGALSLIYSYNRTPSLPPMTWQRRLISCTPSSTDMLETHANRVTIMQKDLQLVKRIKGNPPTQLYLLLHDSHPMCVRLKHVCFCLAASATGQEVRPGELDMIRREYNSANRTADDLDT